MRYAGVGVSESVAGLEALDFAAPQPLDRYDGIVWHTDAPFDAFAGDIERPGPPPVLSSRGSQGLLARARAWRARIRGALEEGKTVCVLVGPERRLAYHTFEDIMEFGRLDPLDDVRRLETEPASGRAATVAGEPFAGALGPLIARAPVHTALRGDFGTPIAKAGAAVLAAYAYTGTGHVLLLPAAGSDGRIGARGWQGLTQLLEALRHGGDWIAFEPWARARGLPGEAALEEALRAARADLARRGEALRALEERAGAMRWRRALIGATGRSLVRALERAFTELGVLVFGHTCGPDVLVLEDRQGFRLVLVVDDADATPEGVRDRLARAGARFEAEFMATARPTIMDARANRLGPDAPPGPDVASLAPAGADLLTPGAMLESLPDPAVG